LSWDEAWDKLFAKADSDPEAEKKARDDEDEKLRDLVVEKARYYLRANWGRWIPHDHDPKGAYQEEPDSVGTNDARARELMAEHPDNFRRRTGTNFTTCVTLPPAAVRRASLRIMPWLHPILGTLRGGLCVATGQFVFADGTNRPGRGDVYLLGIRHLDKKGRVTWEFRHMGIVENPKLGMEGRIEKWTTIDGGQGDSKQGQHRVDRVERRYNPDTGRFTPERFQNNPEKVVLIGWWNITELPRATP
jgi:hypothetical protein